MAEPVLVVHGVATRDSEFFRNEVRKLNETLGNKWNLIPVFWWDLGGQDTDILDCLPEIEQVRALEEQPPSPELLKALFLAPPADEGKTEVRVRAQEDKQSLVLEGAEVDDFGAVRSTNDNEAIRQAVEEQFPQTKFLKHIEDPELLKTVGRVLKESADEARSSHNKMADEEDDLVRGGDDEMDTRGGTELIKNLSRKLISSLDELVGQTTGSVLGNLNQRLRGRIAEPFVRFFGDIFVYQRNQETIHNRIWEAIAANAPGYGTEEKPIHVIAHSLGGIVCFDAALRKDKPLWMKSFLTFGSQSSFFHIIDPRQQLTKYSHDHPATLPATFGSWVSLWDTLDFLAFTAGTVFRLHDGTVPTDIKVTDPISLIIKDKGWTHSIYWETDELISALQKTLGTA